MLPDVVQYFLFIGMVAFMFLLRLDARRFSAAEWDTQDGDWRVWISRISWYGAGIGLALITFALYHSPVSELNLRLGADRAEGMVYGLLFGGAGIAAAFILAILRNRRITFPTPGRYPGGVLTAVGTAFYDEWLFRGLLLGLVYGAAGVVGAFILAILRNGRISLPSPMRYPGGVLSSVGTAFYDEFLFRGVLLGVLLTLDLPTWLAVVAAAAIYTGAVRAGTGSRGIFTLGLWLAIGLVGGALVITTVGIAAALVGHAITRFALFMVMGPPERAAVEQVHEPKGGTGDSGAYVIRPHDARRG